MQSATPEEKADELEKLTENTEMNGIGDVEGVANVLKSIGISDVVENGNEANATALNIRVAKSILNSVSNLVESDFKIADTEAETLFASKTSGRYIS